MFLVIAKFLREYDYDSANVNAEGNLDAEHMETSRCRRDVFPNTSSAGATIAHGRDGVSADAGYSKSCVLRNKFTKTGSTEWQPKSHPEWRVLKIIDKNVIVGPLMQFAV